MVSCRQAVSHVTGRSVGRVLAPVGRPLIQIIIHVSCRLRAATRLVEDAKDDGKDPAEALAEVKLVRHDVQAKECKLHHARSKLLSEATAHFPELLVTEPQLRSNTIGVGVEDEIHKLLVERDVEHYDQEMRLSGLQARHEVWRARYNDEACVLKQYKLDGIVEWKALTKEIKVLNQLAHCPYIVEVQAFFLQAEPFAAYVQLPFYQGGDLLAWLTGNMPVVWQRKALLNELCEALRHIHSHGIAHGDVKLENVLVSIDGPRVTARLADFESARKQRTSAYSVSTSIGSGSAFTELYVAPEILAAFRSGGKPTPTASGDMFSYGVCCLIACCLPPSENERQLFLRRFAVEDRQLTRWSRELARLADEHMPTLLDSLLAHASTYDAALSLRYSASQVLRHPFHDQSAALEASAAATRDAAVELAAIEQEMVRKQREAEYKAAELRRVQAEQEDELQEALGKIERLVERQRHEIRSQEQDLEKKKSAVIAQVKAAEQAEQAAAASIHQAAAARLAAAEAMADQMRSTLAAEKTRIDTEMETKKRELLDQQARADVEMKKLARLRREKRAMPAYWEKTLCTKAKDGFVLVPLDGVQNSVVRKALERLLYTDPIKLQQNGADRRGTHHDRLQFACAWRLEHPSMWDRYMGGQQQVLHGMHLLRRVLLPRACGLPVATERTASGLPALLCTDVNEAMLVHGTNPAVLLNMLSTGLNERFSGTNAGTAFGDGIYFAEDVGKNDQYTMVDERYDASFDLHQRLYRQGVQHPGKVYYLLVCRVALGHPLCTKSAGRAAASNDGRPIFPVSYRELAHVPNVIPPVHYHSLIADRPQARYREFIVFHSEFVYPEYLIAYQRFAGAHGPL